MARPSTAEQATATPIDFDREVKPIFARNCLACHGGVKQAAGLSLVFREAALAETDSGGPCIVPGDPEGSYLLERVAEPDDEMRMPPAEHGPRLTEDEVATLRRWIAEGAAWAPAWSLRPVVEPGVPDDGSDESLGAIDRWVRARARTEGLTPSPEAPRGEWLRRVTLDLVGLPPTGPELEAFLADDTPGAYERVVDRLLASPHFGERWAAPWMDLARYSDTMGFDRDPPRTIWPWRDWLVRSLDADTPWNTRIVQMLAGDMLPGATLEDRLATAMHRNTVNNVEGGTDDEEFRVAATMDRVETTWQALQGTTIGCARCHDHPYEPITRLDYYRALAVFNQTADADLTEDFPLLSVPDDISRFGEAAALDDEAHALREQLQGEAARLERDDTTWSPVRFTEAESTGSTRLRIDPLGGRGSSIVAEGTVTDRSIYSLRSDAAGLSEVAAVRLVASPKDPERAIDLPEMGFVLSRLRLWVVRARLEGAAGPADGVPTPVEEEVFFHLAIGDEPHPFFSAEETLRDTPEGWCAYTRIYRPRWAVFVPSEPLRLGPGDSLRWELKHGKDTDGQDALVIYHLTASLSSDSAWTRYASDPDGSARRERLAEVLRERKAIPGAATPVMMERTGALARRSRAFERGDWMRRAEPVEPGPPAAWPVIPGAGSGNAGFDRLALARWISADTNPLAARVLSNRYWAEMFGRGLVETLGDFGATGAAPSHPELLDLVAWRFVHVHHWRAKPLLRELALTATYRQTHAATGEGIALDPQNRFLARGPRTRLTAEQVRDQALVLSGKLNAEKFGPPVMPFQPEGVWRSPYSAESWKNAEDDRRFRRALYVYAKRNAPYPSLQTFDVPSRQSCALARPSTNTPLQALVTMNDPAYVELAAGLAGRMEASAATPRERIAWGVREATCAAADEGVVDALATLYEAALAERMAEGPPAAPGDPREAATPARESGERFALSIVAEAILNLDEALTK